MIFGLLSSVLFILTNGHLRGESNVLDDENGFTAATGDALSFFFSANESLNDRAKHDCEIGYWKGKKAAEGQLSNSHYKSIYTTYFDVGQDFYNDKKILDIGCGPRGSLEWATNAKARVCVDPLAIEYGELGANQHAMTYVKSGVESMPFLAESFDIVASINNFDHITNEILAIKEVARVLKKGGSFILIVEIHAKPTSCEPRVYTWDFPKKIEAEGFKIKFRRDSETVGYDGCKIAGTQSSHDCPEFKHSDPTSRDGFLTLVLERT